MVVLKYYHKMYYIYYILCRILGLKHLNDLIDLLILENIIYIRKIVKIQIHHVNVDFNIKYREMYGRY